MEIITKELPESYTLIQAQDFHIGAVTCHKQGIYKLRERMKDKGVFAVMPGDCVEAIAPNDKRYALCAGDPEARTAQAQVEMFCQIFKPVADKIIAIGMGNHEYKLINTFDVTRELCRRLGAEYGGYTFVLNCVDSTGRTMHKMFFTHGSGMLRSNAKDPIQRDGNMRAGLKLKLGKYGFTDCIYYGQGHTHRPLVVKPTIEDEVMLVSNRKTVKQAYRYHSNQAANYIPTDARWYGNGGSFLRGYADPGTNVITYAEVAGYGPVELGWLEIDVVDRCVTNVRKVIV